MSSLIFLKREVKFILVWCYMSHTKSILFSKKWFNNTDLILMLQGMS